MQLTLWRGRAAERMLHIFAQHRVVLGRGSTPFFFGPPLCDAVLIWPVAVPQVPVDRVVEKVGAGLRFVAPHI